MTRVTFLPFSTLRLLTLPAGAEPGDEPLLSNAGVLIDDAGARSSWDGVDRPVTGEIRFLTTTGNDLTGPELKALANRLNGAPAPIGLSEASAARVAALFEEAGRLLEPEPGYEGPG